jgi:hypothetical protein
MLLAVLPTHDKPTSWAFETPRHHPLYANRSAALLMLALPRGMSKVTKAGYFQGLPGKHTNLVGCRFISNNVRRVSHKTLR